VAQRGTRKAHACLLAVSELLAAMCAIGALLLGRSRARRLSAHVCLGCDGHGGYAGAFGRHADVAEPAIKTLSFGLAVFCSYLLGGAWGPVVVGRDLRQSGRRAPKD